MEEVSNLMGSHDGGEDGVLGPTQQQLLRPDKAKEPATCTRDWSDGSDLFSQGISSLDQDLVL